MIVSSLCFGMSRSRFSLTHSLSLANVVLGTTVQNLEACVRLGCR